MSQVACVHLTTSLPLFTNQRTILRELLHAHLTVLQFFLGGGYFVLYQRVSNYEMTSVTQLLATISHTVATSFLLPSGFT